ncbi:MAG: hypothetical protein IMZ55_07085 [Acidobacteria bacterium]|nr:hypothetical protein [Acidobacteriota bacterium]
MDALQSREPYLAETKTCVDPPRWGASGGLSAPVLECRQFDMSLSVGTRLGPYEIQAAIGAGGMGEVYKAKDTRLDRTLAIKVLPAGVAADP